MRANVEQTIRTKRGPAEVLSLDEFAGLPPLRFRCGYPAKAERFRFCPDCGKRLQPLAESQKAGEG
jgi:hypothetical protein